MRRDGADDVVEALRLRPRADVDPGVVQREPRDDASRSHACAARPDVLGRGRGKQRREIGACNEDVCRIARSGKAVTQNIQKNLRGRDFGRCVERGEAQGPPEMRANAPL